MGYLTELFETKNGFVFFIAEFKTFLILPFSDFIYALFQIYCLMIYLLLRLED